MDNSKIVEIDGKRFVSYISNTRIEKRIEEIAESMNKEYEGESPMLLVVLNGAILFAAELMKRLKFPLEMRCVQYQSYQGMSAGKNIKQIMGLPKNGLENRRIIVVEDIVDTGNTILYLLEELEKRKVKDVEVATLTLKKEVFNARIPIRYVGFEISNEFIVGFGMDYNQKGRQYPDIYQYKD